METTVWIHSALTSMESQLRAKILRITVALKKLTELIVSHSHTKKNQVSFFTPKFFFSAERWEQRHGTEKRLPGLSMNTKQLFWMTAANVWCSKYRPKSLESRVRTGAHSPGMFRVKGPFSNSKEFAKDFNCPLGSTYNPVDKCEVW